MSGLALSLERSLNPSHRASLMLSAAWSRSSARTFSPAGEIGVFP